VTVRMIHNGFYENSRIQKFKFWGNNGNNGHNGHISRQMMNVSFPIDSR
jgi:hypothetical protein